jgi:radical SAM superfamily enzyme YgiQ (UPF0313 family)
MAKFKVLLLNPPSKHGVAVVRDTLYGCWCKGRANYMWPPLGLAQIGAVLEKAGFEVKLLDAMALKYTFPLTLNKVRRMNLDYVVVNTATITFSQDIELIKQIKKMLPNIKCILIGTHVTAMPEATLKENAVDYIVLGEPDYVIRDLLLVLDREGDISEIKGVGFRKNNKTIITGIADPIENLDELPFPARHLIPKADYFNPLAKRLPYTTMMSSRGCPFRCIYCSSVILYGHKFRPRSAKNVVDEMEEVVRKYGIKEVFFRDETFTFDKGRTIDICKEILRRKLDVSWMTNTRVDCVDDEMLRWMKKAGCHLLKFGVESGSQEVLNNLKKGTTLEGIRKTFKITKRVGISTIAHIMFGSPGETKETIEETIKFVKEIEPDYASFNITTPYPGTELWEMSKYNLGIKDDFSSYDVEQTLENATLNTAFCDMSLEDLNKYYNKAYNSFYFRPRYIIKRLLKQMSFNELFRVVSAGVSLVGFSLENRFRK